MQNAERKTEEEATTSGLLLFHSAFCILTSAFRKRPLTATSCPGEGPCQRNPLLVPRASGSTRRFLPPPGMKRSRGTELRAARASWQRRPARVLGGSLV